VVEWWYGVEPTSDIYSLHHVDRVDEDGASSRIGMDDRPVEAASDTSDVRDIALPYKKCRPKVVSHMEERKKYGLRIRKRKVEAVADLYELRYVKTYHRGIREKGK
jgi:hypothetical protein